jgi:hypothetical protein
MKGLQLFDRARRLILFLATSRSAYGGPPLVGYALELLSLRDFLNFADRCALIEST